MDYYVEDSRRLEGQPKKAIADYVEHNGILVPRKFDSLQEARRSKKKVLLRSEHPQEYDGASGLLDSFSLSAFESPGYGSEDVEETKRKYFRDLNRRPGIEMYKQYCRFLDLDEDEFRQDTSFSIWEGLDGFNRTVVADSAITGRYHVMTYFDEKDKHLYNYAIADNGELVQEFCMPLPKDLRDDLRNLIEVYEAIRNLDRFDPNHCPIMEFQTYDGRNYFLQYHRARDFESAEFLLDRPIEEGETEASFVRGATPKDGVDSKTTVYYHLHTYDLDTDEDGSYDFHWNHVFSELMARRRRNQMISFQYEHATLEYEFLKIIVKHFQRSKLFKPQVSIIHNILDVLNEETVEDYARRALKEHTYLDLHIVSDGRKAFVRRI